MFRRQDRSGRLESKTQHTVEKGLFCSFVLFWFRFSYFRKRNQRSLFHSSSLSPNPTWSSSEFNTCLTTCFYFHCTNTRLCLHKPGDSRHLFIFCNSRNISWCWPPAPVVSTDADCPMKTFKNIYRLKDWAVFPFKDVVIAKLLSCLFSQYDLHVRSLLSALEYNTVNSITLQCDGIKQCLCPYLKIYFHCACVSVAGVTSEQRAVDSSHRSHEYSLLY